METFNLKRLLSRVSVETDRETTGKLSMLTGTHQAMSFQFPIYRMETGKQLSINWKP